MTFTVDTTAGVIVSRTATAASRGCRSIRRKASSCCRGCGSRSGWNQKYTYTFSWLGPPGHPAARRHDAHPGGDSSRAPRRHRRDRRRARRLAHLLREPVQGARSRPRDRRGHRDSSAQPAAIEAHPLRPLITLVEGSSIDPGDRGTRTQPDQSRRELGARAARLESLCAITCAPSSRPTHRS